MLILAGSLATFVFGTGMRVLEMCHEAKQCEIEVARIAVRTQSVLATLKNAGEHFSDEAQLETSLLELKAVFEILQSLVGRCGAPTSLSKRASTAVLKRKNPNKQALADAEARLEQITKDLGLPMLTDIKQQLNRMQSESVASASRDTDALAEVIRSEIQRAMMVSMGSGVTIKDTIDAKVARIEGDTYDERKRAPPAEKAAASGAGQAPGGVSSSKKVGSMVMMLGRVRYENLKESEVLGQGTFGVVMAGTYDGREVAIKRARGCLGSTQIMEAFRQEVEIQYAMRHANIVEVIAFGLGDAEHPPCLVMERMKESLYDLLGVQGIDLDPVSKVSIVQDVSEGLRFLHSRGIVHRDLKSLNILLDEEWTAKISDFGLAKVNSSIATVTGGTGFHSKVGSDFWMAPEVHSNRKATRASDVFSLHVVMWEVLAQERAGHGKPIGERLQTNPAARLPPIEMDCSAAVESHLRNVVDGCGRNVPSERPKMDEVCSVMTAVLGHLENPQENPLEEVAAPDPRQQVQPHEDDQHKQRHQQQQQQPQQQQRGSPQEQGQRQSEEGQERTEGARGQHRQHQYQQQQPQEGQKGAAGRQGQQDLHRDEGEQGEQKRRHEERQEDGQGGREDNKQEQQQPRPQPPQRNQSRPQPKLPAPALMKHPGGANESRALHYDNREVAAEHRQQEPRKQGSEIPDNRHADYQGGSSLKKDYPHRTIDLGTRETAIMSVGSNASSSLSSSNTSRPSRPAERRSHQSIDTSRPRPAPRPAPRSHQSVGGTPRPALATSSTRTVSSMGSAQPTQHDARNGPPPPYVSRESDASFPPGTTKRERRNDRAVLFRLLREWSPSSVASNSTARSEWTRSAGWGTRIAMSDWYGVCTRYEDDEAGRNERVTAIKLPLNGLSGGLLEDVTTLDCLVDLDLKDNHLAGVLSASIGKLRFLETLNLSGTKVTGIIPREFGNLVTLTVLDLHHTSIHGTIPRELGDLVGLTVLDLHQTSLHGTIPETLGKLVCLKTLDLSNCDLSGCIPTEFERLKALRVLRLGHNRLTGEIPAVLATLDRLEEINLGGNNLTGKILAVSGSWPGLRVLDMSENRLEGCIPPELLEYKHLTTLILYRNFGITGRIPPWIGSMTSLEEMDLSAMQLGGEIPKELGQLTRLTRLSLGSCGLVGTIPPELGQLKSLQHLALYGNSMTGSFPREVLQIPTLRNVNFENNRFTVRKAMMGGTRSAVKGMLPKGCSLRL